MKDIAGNEIKLGDWVATDTTAYRTSNLRVGTITEVRENPRYGNEVKVSYEVRGTKRSVWRYPHGVIKVVKETE